jgi:hypothetical protein
MMPHSLQLWCRDNMQRAQLLCYSCSLSGLAFRLARAVSRHDGSRSFERQIVSHISKRCFSVCAWRLWIEILMQR